MLRTVPVLIPAGAGVTTGALPIQGDFIFVQDSSTPFNLKIDGVHQIEDVERGFLFHADFKSLEFINQSAVAVILKICVGIGASLEDYRPQTKALSAVDSATIYNGIPASNNIVANAVLAEAASARRVEVGMLASGANAGVVYFLSLNANNKIFGLAAPGQTFRTTFSGPVYLFTVNLTDSVTVWATYY